jgi:hypothetical protein
MQLPFNVEAIHGHAGSRRGLENANRRAAIDKKASESAGINVCQHAMAMRESERVGLALVWLARPCPLVNGSEVFL